MSTLATSSTAPASNSFLGNLMRKIDRLLMAWHEVSVRNGDIPYFGL